MPWLEREEEFIYYQHIGPSFPSLNVLLLMSWILGFGFGSLREREDTLSTSKWTCLVNKWARLVKQGGDFSCWDFPFLLNNSKLSITMTKFLLPTLGAIIAYASNTNGFVIIPSSFTSLNWRYAAATSSSLSMNKKSKSKRSSGGGGFGKKATAINIKTKKATKPDVTYAGSIRPFPQSPTRIVDPAAVLSIPDYAIDGVPKKKGSPYEIEIKTPEEIHKMRASGRCAREVLDIAGSIVKAGVTTDEIDAAVHAACVERGAYPSPLNYRNFPKSCCTSVNEVICHGIPDKRPLEDGDIINIDITVYLDGYHGDCSEMFVVGGKDALDEKGRKLIQTTYDCWLLAMELVKPGVNYNVIGKTIEDHVKAEGFSTVRSFCGHG